MLKKAVSVHPVYSQITIKTTIEAFFNFLELVDNDSHLVDFEYLKSLGFPKEHFFQTLHSDLFTSERFLIHTDLIKRANKKLDFLIQKFINDATVRQLIFERTKYLANFENYKDPYNTSSATIPHSDIVTLIAKNLLQYMKTNNLSEHDLNNNSIIQDFIRLHRNIITDYLEDFNPKSIASIVLKSYYKTFDPFSDVFLSTQIAFEKKQTQKNRLTLGVLLAPIPGGFKVKNTFTNVEDNHSVLKVGDIITGIENGSFTNRWLRTDRLTGDEFSSLIQESESEIIRVRILRDGQKSDLTITAKPRSTAVYSVGTPTLHQTQFGNIASVSLLRFAKDSHLVLKHTLSKLHFEQDIKGLVLDLRNNPGGWSNEMLKILELFVAEPIGYIEQEKNHTSIFKSPNKKLPEWDFPLIVLVNEASASASEAISTALQAYKRAIIIGGPKTFGKGSVQNFIQNKFTVNITTSLYFSPDGTPIQGQGVNVDIPLPTLKIKPRTVLDYRNALQAQQLRSTPPRLFPFFEHLDQTLAELKEKSRQRQKDVKGPIEQTVLDEQNLNEAFNILNDWLALEEKNRK